MPLPPPPPCPASPPGAGEPTAGVTMPAGNRRAFLRWMMGSAATAATAGGLYQWSQGSGGVGGPGSFANATVPRAITGGDPSGRALVVVELSGGNDGLATLVPYASGRLHDLRGDLAAPAEELLILDDDYALHQGLAPLNERGLAVLMGVGTPQPNQSHFDMEQRWWAGDQSGTERPATGFLGRLCDSLDDGSPITGVALGGPTPALLSARAVTVGLPDPYGAWYLTEDSDFARNLRRAMGAMSGGPDGELDLVRGARRGLSNALAFADVLAGYEDPDTSMYPGGDLTGQLSLAAWLLASGAGVRVVHVKIGGFDTHDGGRGAHDGPITEVGGNVAAFLDDLDNRGLLETTLVVTTSEFGRRPGRNGNGTDHGSASCALLAGPVHAGLHGEHPSLSQLDETENLIATVPMADYYATPAETWLGIEAGSVLPERATSIGGLLSV